jgi:hypothetical protein
MYTTNITSEVHFVGLFIYSEKNTAFKMKRNKE